MESNFFKKLEFRNIDRARSTLNELQFAVKGRNFMPYTGKLINDLQERVKEYDEYVEADSARAVEQ